MYIGEIVRRFHAEPVAALPGLDRVVPVEPAGRATPAFPIRAAEAGVTAPVVGTEVLEGAGRDR